MPYTSRNDKGELVAVSEVPQEGFVQEDVAPDELSGYLEKLGGEASALDTTDQGLARVLEDLIQLLIDKGLILFTELPQSAQDKVIERQRLRRKLSNRLDLLSKR